jgi:hypothetical protein
MLDAAWTWTLPAGSLGGPGAAEALRPGALSPAHCGWGAALAEAYPTTPSGRRYRQLVDSVSLEAVLGERTPVVPPPLLFPPPL